MARWIDLSHYGLRLALSETRQGRFLVLLGDIDTLAYREAVTLGFKKSPSGYWVRNAQGVMASDILRAFARATTVDLPEHDYIIGRKAPSDELVPSLSQANTDRSVAVALEQWRPVGRNADGEEVCEDGGGRFIRGPNGILRESSTAIDGRFLRADEQNLDDCADGLAADIAAGRRIDRNTFIRWIADIVGRDVGLQDPLYVAAQEAVEAALVRHLNRTGAGQTPYDLFDGAVRLYESQPVFSGRDSQRLRLQQFSTPLPLAVAAQQMLGHPMELRGSTVLEPCIGHGALVSSLAGTHIIGLDLDPARPARTRAQLGRLNQIDIQAGDATTVEFPNVEYVICNPPFGGLETPVDHRGLRVTRLDHLIFLRALEKRHDAGRAVAILAGDPPARNQPGHIAGGSTRFFAWLADHYEIEGVAEIDGGLYARQGAEYPTRMVVVGRRREAPLKQGSGLSELPAPLPVLKTFDEVWTWSQGIVSAQAFEEIFEETVQDVEDRVVPVAGEVLPPVELGIEPAALELLELKSATHRWRYTGLENGIHTFARSDGSPGPNLGLGDQEIRHVINGGSLTYQGRGRGGKVRADLEGLHRDLAELRDEARLASVIDAVGDTATSDPFIQAACGRYRELVQAQGVAEERVASWPVHKLVVRLVAAAMTGTYVRELDRIDRVTSIYMPLLAPQHSRASRRLFAELIGQPLPVTSRATRELFTGRPIGVAPVIPWYSGPMPEWLQQQPSASLPPVAEEPEMLADTPEQEPNPEEVQELPPSSPSPAPKPPSGANPSRVPRQRDGRTDGPGRASGPVPVQSPPSSASTPELPPVEQPVLAAPEPISLAENSYQMPYRAHSQVGESTAMIPRNMAAATDAALTRVEDALGPIDELVANRLGWTLDQLKGYLSPDQIDYVGLKIYAEEVQGRGIINADQTGMGKGRSIAAVIRYSLLRNRRVIFSTDTANLFSDLVRDLRDIDTMGLVKPLILNNNTDILDTITGEVLIERTPAAEVKAMLDSDEGWPDGINVVFTTYTQFSRPGPKISWLIRAAEGAHFVGDEIHVATGQSHMGATIVAASRRAAIADYFSATYAKGARNMGVFERVLPRGLSTSLADDLEAGGEPLQEILSEMLARDGVLVRREHDLSKLEFVTIVDTERTARNREYVDKLAPILSAMAYLGGDIKGFVSRVNLGLKAAAENVPEEDRVGMRMGASSMEFGSRLYNINRLFMLALKIDMIVDRALNAVRNGEKPIVTLESTMEQVLKGVIFDDEEANVQGNDARLATGVRLDFKDVLRNVLDRLCTITYNDFYGNAERRTIDDSKTLEFRDRILELIDAYPDLNVSPLDDIRQQLVEAGVTVEELSGRNLAIENGEVVIRAKEPRTAIVARFNSGQSDALMLSRAGSTGISAHASPRFRDQRRRVMIEGQIANDVNKRLQFFGRANRRDQVSSPRIETLSTGLAGESRLLAMQNTKLRKLSANTTSNRSNSVENKEVADVFNNVGERVARQLLAKEPELAKRLCITTPEEMTDGGSRIGENQTYFIDKIMGRIMMLTSDEQDDLYNRILSEYDAIIADYDARGVNPFKTRELEGAWRVTKPIRIFGSDQASSAFDQPVYLSTLEGERICDPLRGETVRQMVEAAAADMLRDTRHATPLDLIREKIEIVQNTRAAHLSKLVPAGKTLEEMLDAAGPNGVKTRAEVIDTVLNIARRLNIGGFIQILDDGVVKSGVIVDVRVPGPGREHIASEWRVRYLLAGDERTRNAGLNMFSTLPSLVLNPEPASLRGFDEAEGGRVREIRLALTGNLFRAAQLSGTSVSQGLAGRGEVKSVRLGSPATFKDHDGLVHRAILVHRDLTPEQVLKIPVQVTAETAFEFLVDRGGDRARVIKTEQTDGLDLLDSPVIEWNGYGRVNISVSGTASGTKRLFDADEIIAITGNWYGNKKVMSVNVEIPKMAPLLNEMEKRGLKFYLSADERDWINSHLDNRNDTYNNTLKTFGKKT